MPRAPLALALVAVLAVACQSSSTPDPRLALVDGVERVAELLEQDQPCRALDVAEALPMQDEALEEPVRDAVVAFVRDLGETIQCSPPQPSPTSTPTPTAPDTPTGPPPDAGDGDDDDDDDKGEGEGNGNGGDDDDGGPPDDRGRGNGNGSGGGNGRGND